MGVALLVDDDTAAATAVEGDDSSWAVCTSGSACARAEATAAKDGPRERRYS